MEAEVTYYIGESYHYCNFLLVAFGLILLINFISSIKNKISLKDIIISIISLSGIISYALFYMCIITENSETHSVIKYYKHPGLIIAIIPIIALVLTSCMIYGFIKNKFFDKNIDNIQKT